MDQTASQSMISSRRQVIGSARVRMWLTLSLSLLALVFMSMSANALQPGVKDIDTLEQGIYYALIGVLILGAALLATKSRIVVTTFKSTIITGQANWILGSIGVVCMFLLAESSAHTYGIDALVGISQHIQFGLLVAGCVLLIWGYGGIGWPCHWIATVRQLSKTDKLEIAFVLGITLLGLVIRFWRLETALHQFVDELNFATVSAFFWDNRIVNILEPIVRGFPAIYPYMQNEMSAIFGRSLFTLRSVSAILGALAVPATYLLARALFDRPTAIVAGFLIVAFPPHLHFSRFALNNIADATFGVVAIAFLARGWRYNRRIDFAIAGVALGLTQYFYEGGRLIFPPLVILWSGYGLIAGYSRRRLMGLVWAALLALIVAGPIYMTLESLGAPLSPRANLTGQQSSLLGLYENTQDWDTYLPQLRLSFQVYFSQEEYLVIWYGGNTTLILLFLAPFFLLGIAYTLWTSFGPTIVLPLWIVLTSLGISLINDTGAYVRYVAVFPALVILIAVGIRVVLDLLVPRMISTDRKAVLNSLVAIGVLLCFIHTVYYFGPHLDALNRQLRRDLAYDGQDVAFRLAEYPSGTRAYILADGVEDQRYLNGIYGYMVDNPHQAIRIYSPDAVDSELLNSITLDHPTLLFLPPDADKKFMLILHRYFVLAPPSSTPFSSVPDEKRLVMYEILDFQR